MYFKPPMYCIKTPNIYNWKQLFEIMFQNMTPVSFTLNKKWNELGNYNESKYIN